MVAVVIGSLILVGSMVALSFWLARWARASAGELSAGRAERDALTHRVDELTGHVQDRDRAIKDKTEELDRERAARAAIAGQRDEAMALVDALAAKNPNAVAVAVRDKLKRLRALAAEVPDLPAPVAATTPEAG